MQAPKLGCEFLGDQYAPGTDVSVEKIFAMKELLITERDMGHRVKHKSVIHSEMKYICKYFQKTSRKLHVKIEERRKPGTKLAMLGQITEII